MKCRGSAEERCSKCTAELSSLAAVSMIEDFDMDYLDSMFLISLDTKETSFQRIIFRRTFCHKIPSTLGLARKSGQGSVQQIQVVITWRFCPSVQNIQSLTFDPRCSGPKYTYKQLCFRLFGVLDPGGHFSHFRLSNISNRSPSGAIWSQEEEVPSRTCSIVSKKAECSELLFGAWIQTVRGFLHETYNLMEAILLSIWKNSNYSMTLSLGLMSITPYPPEVYFLWERQPPMKNFATRALNTYVCM